MEIYELKQNIENFEKRLHDISKFLYLEDKMKELSELTKQSEEQTFWNNKELAQEVIGKITDLKELINPYAEINANLAELQEYINGCEDPSFKELFDNDIEQLIQNIKTKLDKFEIFSYLSDKLDDSNVYLTIKAGEGGTEACDWAEMLARMYRRYSEIKNWKCSVLDMLDGGEAGIKSITMKIDGKYAYGLLKSEHGIHRLVRVSPFDSNKRRHTSFTAVDVMPEIDKSINIEIPEEDIRTDVFRASGKGGQCVNRTDSAVRLTHKPTGIAVACQAERSQHMNKAIAMRLLKSKLYEIELKKQQAETDKIRGEVKENTWGSQIRSYVFFPYQMVKDLRTNYQTSDIDSVMDGHLQEFIDSYLKFNKEEK